MKNIDKFGDHTVKLEEVSGEQVSNGVCIDSESLTSGKKKMFFDQNCKTFQRNVLIEEDYALMNMK